MKRFCTILVLGVLAISLKAQAAVSYNEVKAAYLNLDFTRGNTILAAQLDMKSSEAIRLLALRDFLHSLLWLSKPGVEGYITKSDYWHSKLEDDRRTDPMAIAARTEISIYQAVLASQISDYKGSATSLMKAYKTFTKTSPGMRQGDIDKISGIMGVLFKQVPDQAYKFLKVAGIRPSLLSGYQGLEKYYRESPKGSADRTEAFLLMITALKEFSTDPGASWKFTRESRGEFENNWLARYQAAMGALKAGQTLESIRMLELPAGAAAPFPTWNYQLGRCYQFVLDPRSDQCFTRFLNTPGVDAYRHAATLRLGWNYILRNDARGAEKSFAQVKALPEAFTTFDKQALREASGVSLPESNLLRIRILYDGGSYMACLTEAEAIERLPNLPDATRAEVSYRKGRCYQRLGQPEEAITAFNRVLGFDGKIKSYLLPNSALQIGYLYKEKGQFELARKYLNKCLELNHYEFREGISRQAQAALRELQ